MGLIPGLGRSPGEGNENPLQYSCLENPWTEEPGGQLSMGLQRVRHNLETQQQLETSVFFSLGFQLIECGPPTLWRVIYFTQSLPI